MGKNKKSDFYLVDGKLDLSILDEPIEKDTDNTILEEIEAIALDTKEKNISETLEEMAMIFGIEPEDENTNKEDIEDIFDKEVLDLEKKEFNM